MNLAGMNCAVIAPRFILALFHFSGKLLRIKRNSHLRAITNTGLAVALIIFAIIICGILCGRFNFKREEVSISIKGLNKNLDGLRIVHLSDIHLPGFYHHQYLLKEVMDMVTSLKPDLIINTGDFISFGSQEFGRSDSILALAKCRYGNFAVLGNHDIGTYNPFFSEGDIEKNIAEMNLLISASGYKVLNDENIIIQINGEKIGLIGVITRGRHPKMIHGDLPKAMAGLDSVSLKTLLAHDPNQWRKDVAGKTDIDLTLSGHTHGMQLGIMTKKFRWSPSKYFYPDWGGLYKESNQYLYVNRGLGVLAIPFRIWMPPEITIITIKAE
jgi:predicted MPP superfamily phosphohydrolase